MEDKITLSVSVTIPRKRLEKIARESVDEFLGRESKWGRNDGDVDELVAKEVKTKAAALVKTADVQTVIDTALAERLPDAIREAIADLDVARMVRDGVTAEVERRVDEAVEKTDTAALLAVIAPAEPHP